MPLIVVCDADDRASASDSFDKELVAKLCGQYQGLGRHWHESELIYRFQCGRITIEEIEEHARPYYPCDSAMFGFAQNGCWNLVEMMVRHGGKRPSGVNKDDFIQLLNKKHEGFDYDARWRARALLMEEKYYE
jgi:hypothetical protein